MIPPNTSHNHLRIAILGSGRGSTADAILAWERQHPAAFRTVQLVCTSERSGIVDVAQRHQVPVSVAPYTESDAFARALIDLLREQRVELLVLAGFLKLLPSAVIEALGGMVINTHPALLPRHGGPGMFGLRVHQAVLEAGDAETGVSVHWVTDKYDEGAVIAQHRVPVEPGDTPETLQLRVKEVEGGFLALTIDQLALTDRRNEEKKYLPKL